MARKIARMSRPLSREAVRVVDEAVAAAVGQSPSRLLAVAEAKVVEADQAAHQERVETNRRQKGVWFPQPAPGEVIDDDSGAAGVRSVFGRLDEADAVELEQAIEDLADVLEQRGDYTEDEPPTRDQLRADSLGLLARPADALALLRGEDPDGKASAEDVDDEAGVVGRAPARRVGMAGAGWMGLAGGRGRRPERQAQGAVLGRMVVRPGRSHPQRGPDRTTHARAHHGGRRGWWCTCLT